MVVIAGLRRRRYVEGLRLRQERLQRRRTSTTSGVEVLAHYAPSVVTKRYPSASAFQQTCPPSDIRVQIRDEFLQYLGLDPDPQNTASIAGQTPSVASASSSRSTSGSTPNKRFDFLDEYRPALQLCLRIAAGDKNIHKQVLISCKRGECSEQLNRVSLRDRIKELWPKQDPDNVERILYATDKNWEPIPFSLNRRPDRIIEERLSFGSGSTSSKGRIPRSAYEQDIRLWGDFPDNDAYFPLSGGGQLLHISFSSHASGETRPKYQSPLSFSHLAFLLGCFGSPIDPGMTFVWQGNRTDPTYMNACYNIGLYFTLSFAAPPPKSIPYCFLKQWQYLILTFQSRYFSQIESNWASASYDDGKISVQFDDHGSEGLVLQRQLASLEGKDGPVYLSERVCSVLAHIDRYPSNGNNWYTITILTDDSLPFFGTAMTRKNSMGLWGLKPTERGVGVNQSLLTVLCLFAECELHWNSTLDVIDAQMGVSLSDFYSEQRWTMLMVDDLALTRSGEYFKALQILRLIQDWAEQSLRDFETLKRTWWELLRDDVQAPPGGILKENWETALRQLKAMVNNITERVERKKIEIESLRDGLFNGTSVREATRGTALNRAIYMFTVITIFFTPMSFMAVNPLGFAIPELISNL
ncbi:hypothetical protein LLEC1_01398 [Akanthomyces lecanii]|uniref:Uncharacterized protein n=1 Tax=Cordyceps confragosa TaxID=2714763 RepID=A0A179I1R6_CORDF|nr:hypothetical protein LLEC1_01398 [Akanthomyces lecanii]